MAKFTFLHTRENTNKTPLLAKKLKLPMYNKNPLYQSIKIKSKMVQYVR